MMKLNCVNLEAFLGEFTSLEQNITEVQAKNSTLELMVEDSSRVLKHSQTKERSLVQDRDSLLITVKQLQQMLEEQCNIRVENERLKNELEELKRNNEKIVEEGEAEVQRLVAEMRTEADRHQRALNAERRQSSRAVEEARREALNKMEAREAELKKLLEQKDEEIEEIRRRLRDQDRERQSELLKLQMEFGAKLARVQSSAQQQQQQHGSNLPQNIFKRKLQFLQEEKNKEVAALRQRIKELEDSQQARLKRRKVSFNI